jgi:transcriptional regulator with XRE-family HTH domain
MPRKVDGERLVRLRLERFMERGDLAARSGVSYSTLYKMERQDYLPSIRKLNAVARALKVSPEELVISEREEALAG